jgi:ribonuclease VapC
LIVVDSSALVAIARRELEADDFIAKISERSIMIGAPTLLETRLVLQRLMANGADDFIDGFVESPVVTIVAFSLEHYRVAAAAFRRYGRGRGHPAKLNFGDCMSYAVAKLEGAPLLYKGRDFTHTDIRPAYLP